MSAARIETKQSAGWVNEDGTTVEPHLLYRYVDDAHKPGCWYSTLERARASYERIVKTAPTLDLDNGSTRMARNVRAAFEVDNG